MFSWIVYSSLSLLCVYWECVYDGGERREEGWVSGGAAQRTPRTALRASHNGLGKVSWDVAPSQRWSSIDTAPGFPSTPPPPPARHSPTAVFPAMPLSSHPLPSPPHCPRNRPLLPLLSPLLPLGTTRSPLSSHPFPLLPHLPTSSPPPFDRASIEVQLLGGTNY